MVILYDENVHVKVMPMSLRQMMMHCRGSSHYAFRFELGLHGIPRFPCSVPVGQLSIKIELMIHLGSLVRLRLESSCVAVSHNQRAQIVDRSDAATDGLIVVGDNRTKRIGNVVFDKPLIKLLVMGFSRLL